LTDLIIRARSEKVRSALGSAWQLAVRCARAFFFGCVRFRPRPSSYLALVLAFLVATGSIRYADPFFLQALRLIAFDTYQRLAPESYDPNLPIRVVNIDEESLATIGQWPWPRTTLRDLVHALAAAGAASIAFDILFAEPDRTSLNEIVKRLPPPQARLLASAVAGQPSNDAVFAAALEEGPSVLATVLVNTEGGAVPQPKAGFAVAGDDPRAFVAPFRGASRNLEALDAAAHGIGAINWIPDQDEVVRRVATIYRIGDTFIPTLAAEALRIAQGATTYVLKSSNASGETALGSSTGLNHVRVGEVEIPTDASGALFLKFRHQAATYIPAWKVLAGQVPQDEIAGRIILIGSNAPGLFDYRATPLDPAVPGVEIHAQMLERILAHHFLTRPDYAVGLEEFAVMLLGIMLALVLPRVSASSAAVIGLLTMAVVMLGGWAAFRYSAVLIDPSYPALSVGSIAAGITIYVYRQVETQRSEIRQAFGRYLAPAVVEEIIADPARLVLGGEERDLTLMFCDVRNFTSISEKLTASELTHFINELLSPLSEIILERRGTIDKYMGDAIMAFWNAPLDDPNHVAHACQAAIEMTRRMEELNRHWQARASVARGAFSEVHIGIGINTGRCCVGNLGSTYRFDYSALGDEVNVTARLESLSKIYGVTAVVAAQVRAQAKDFPTLELDSVQVKGRARPVCIHTFLELLGADRVKLEHLKILHSQFLTAYRAQQWADAQRLLAACHGIGVLRLDRYYALFEDRIGTLRKTSLPPDWDGSFAMTEK
jgi:adenylate cyclase